MFVNVFCFPDNALDKPLTDDCAMLFAPKLVVPEQLKLTVDMLLLVVVVLNPSNRAFNEKEGKLTHELM